MKELFRSFLYKKRRKPLKTKDFGVVSWRPRREDKEDVLLLEGLHGRLVDTLELFGDHDGCCSVCDALRRNIDAVPGQAENFTDSHAAGEGKVDSQFKTGVITNVEREKNRLSIPDLAFFRHSLRDGGMAIFRKDPFCL